MSTSAGRPVIAIDGPAGAGKSTAARLLADQLGYLYIDTGAMYRALTLKALRANLNLADTQALARLAASTNIQLQPEQGGVRVLLDGEDVSDSIRTPAVSEHAATVALAGPVREQMVKLQRAMAAGGGVVMDGRDIGSHVLPNAQYKFFLDASLTVRARRRAAQFAAAGLASNPAEVEKQIEERDYHDTHREVAPLVQAADAIYIDTTGLSVDEVVEAILEHCTL